MYVALDDICLILSLDSVATLPRGSGEKTGVDAGERYVPQYYVTRTQVRKCLPHSLLCTV